MITIALTLALGLCMAPPPESSAATDSSAATGSSAATRSAVEETAAPPETASRAEGPSEAPPHYTDADIDQLRARYNLRPDPRVEPRKPKWRCLIADPSCGFGIEVLATTAYAYRARQGNVAIDGVFLDWHSARIAYDLWLNFPAHTQTVGTYKFTRLTLGPKLGVVASDNQDVWGNMGIALRYWFTRPGNRADGFAPGPWSPALEFTSALSFKLLGQDGDGVITRRSPVGVTADIGLSVGGWGAIILGGQYDSPLAREELPERFRVSAAGQVFVGFRGNILWGAPAAAAVGTHIAIQRSAPPQP